MKLNADNLKDITYRTKKHHLKKADAEITLALVPGSLMDEAQKIIAASPKPEKKPAASSMDTDVNKAQQKDYDKKMAAYSKAIKAFGFKILSASVVDDKGAPVFKDIKAFEAMAPAVQEEITEAAYDYNGLTLTASDDEAKD